MGTKLNREWPKTKARAVLSSLCIDMPTEVDIEDLTYSRGLLVIQDALQSGDARLVHKKGSARGIVRINSAITNEGRRRFAIAHELGHWELHRNETQVDIFNGSSSTYVYSKSRFETEANIFASELLMPSSAFRALCKDRLPSVQLINDLSKKFQTSFTSTAWKYIDECEENCAFAISENFRVRYSHGKPYVSIPSGFLITVNTFAYDCASGRQTGSTMEIVPTNSWFPEALPRTIVRECSFKMGGYGSVFSLLWIQ